MAQRTQGLELATQPTLALAFVQEREQKHEPPDQVRAPVRLRGRGQRPARLPVLPPVSVPKPAQVRMQVQVQVRQVRLLPRPHRWQALRAGKLPP